jgi:hypothetical protein
VILLKVDTENLLYVLSVIAGLNVFTTKALYSLSLALPPY